MTTIQEVIQSGKIQEPAYSVFQGGYWQLDNILISLFLLCILVFLVRAYQKKEGALIRYNAVILVLGIAIVFLKESVDLDTAKIEYEKELAHWYNETAKNYIAGVEKQQHEISYFKISEDAPTKSEFWFGSKSTLNEEQLQFATFTYNKDKTVSGWFIIKPTLDNDKEPYVEFAEGTQDLGNGIEKGFYNVVVYLPANYLEKGIQ